MTDDRIKFVNFDKPIDITFRDIAHWEQWGCIQFVTLRLSDSLPNDRIEELKKQKESLNECDTSNVRVQLRKLMAMYEYYVDSGNGSCLFAFQDVRRILESILLFADDELCVIWQFVIMPNHVHLLVSPNHDLESFLDQVMSNSTKQINSFLGRKGKLWIRDPFDRMPRNAMSLVHYYNYIKSNPRFLAPDKYSYYEHPEFRNILEGFIAQQPAAFEPLC